LILFPLNGAITKSLLGRAREKSKKILHGPNPAKIIIINHQQIGVLKDMVSIGLHSGVVLRTPLILSLARQLCFDFLGQGG
jgi:hypothetical protein